MKTKNRVSFFLLAAFFLLGVVSNYVTQPIAQLFATEHRASEVSNEELARRLLIRPEMNIEMSISPFSSVWFLMYNENFTIETYGDTTVILTSEQPFTLNGHYAEWAGDMYFLSYHHWEGTVHVDPLKSYFVNVNIWTATGDGYFSLNR